MKVLLGVLIGVSLMFAFQKLMKEGEKTEPKVTQTTLQQPIQKQEIPPDFLIFYSQFHNDSLFQVEHINFPLEGIPNYADSLTLAHNDFKWSQENWEMHKLTDERKNNFHEGLVVLDPGFIKEYVSVGKDEKQLWMERRFYKSGDEWRLIYFAGLNKMDIIK